MKNYNPDVLNCLANLSNDEVFTPPTLANQVLDMLPQELFCSPDTKFLDPVSKSGVFLREIVKRLDRGLQLIIPDRQQRIDHIMHHQVFGIATIELTSYISRRSLYCSREADSQYSVSHFDSAEGNIVYRNLRHTWQKGKCKYCGASQDVYDRTDADEHYAYQFIHTDNPQRLFPNMNIGASREQNGTRSNSAEAQPNVYKINDFMKFDVIIGNPPYQLSDGGNSTSAKPLYHLFIEQAKKLNPRYLTMIVPSRWFIGGKGLDDFRSTMLNDRRIRTIVDFENSYEAFPGVDIAGGVCYFLWDRDNKGLCHFVNMKDGQTVFTDRYLNEYPVLIRQAQAIPIIKKIASYRENNGIKLSDTASTRKPFGLPTNYAPTKEGIPCWFIQKIGLQYAESKDVIDNKGLLDKWKLLLPIAPIAGQTDFTKPIGFYYEGNTRIAKPGECCTESWFVAGTFDSEYEVFAFRSYMFTKIVRFLLLQSVVSQHVTKQNFIFVPDLGHYEGVYTDDTLRKRWNISDEEWAYIDSRIKSVDEIGNK